MPKVKRVTRPSSEKPAATAAKSESQPALRERTTRVPFGGFRRRLEVANKDPNYFYYWQKNLGDNIQRMLDAGFEFVSRRDQQRYAPEALVNQETRGGNESVVDRVEVHGGRDPDVGEYNLILMRQPMKWHLEDMAIAEQRNAEVDQSIYRAQFKGDQGDQDENTRYGNIDVTVKHEE